MMPLLTWWLVDEGEVVGWGTKAVVPIIFPGGSCVYRTLVVNFENFRERFVYEDDWDEDGETLFGESSDVPDESAQVESDDDE